ncbi:MAG: histone [archaeon]
MARQQGTKKDFPRSRIDEIFRKSAPELRVSEDAKETLLSLLEILAIEISRQAILYSQTEKRKSVTAADINRAIKELWD